MCISPFILTAISTGFQIISAISQGNQQAEMYDYQARQAEADGQANRELAEVRADKVRKAGKAQQSQARAALAASGVEVGAGTPVKIVQDIGRDAEADARQELLYGERVASRDQADANAYGMASDNARSSGYMRAGGSLLSAAPALRKGWIGAKQPSYPQGNNPDEWY